jgi:hypothetical protein
MVDIRTQFNDKWASIKKYQSITNFLRIGTIGFVRASLSFTNIQRFENPKLNAVEVKVIL